MKPAFRQLGVDFSVHNLAASDVPDLELAWCLPDEHPPDVVIWDYASNPSPARLETWLRYILTKWPRPPLLMVHDWNDATDEHSRVLEWYAEQDAMIDTV